MQECTNFPKIYGTRNKARRLKGGMRKSHIEYPQMLGSTYKMSLGQPRTLNLCTPAVMELPGP